MKKSNILKGLALVVGVVLLSAVAFVTIETQTSNELLLQSSTELVAMNTFDFDGKCGEGKCGEGKKSEKKEGKKKHKCGEGKCGEGKCGKSETKEGEKTKKKEKEHKCGEGKCGGQ